MSRYRHPAMKQFTEQQVRFAPREQKSAQLARAEELLHEVVEGKDYPYQYVCFRVTQYRPDSYPDLVLEASDVQHDLRLFIEDLSSSANITPEEAGEAVLTVEEISQQFNISTKTVNRWRDRGLVSRRFLVDGRKRVGFLKSSVDRFVEVHADDVERGTRFSQLTDDEREQIIERARQMAQSSSATLAEVSRRIADEMARSPETVRYTIKHHDREHPEDAIFSSLRSPLDDDAKRKIYSAYRRGISIDALSTKYRRTRSSIYRIINEVRADRVVAQPIDYIYHDSFDDPEQQDVILGEEPAPNPETRAIRPPAGLPPYLQSLYEVPLLNRDQEQHLFRKMNYLLHQAKLRRENLDPNQLKAGELDEIESLQDEAHEIKRRLVRANLRLVVSIAKRHAGLSANLFELISDGNVSLMRAVEKFDYSRGFKFSTYASWAIIKNFARTIPAENRHRDRYLTGQELAFELTPDNRADEYEVESSHKQMQSAVENILSRLDERERKVIIYRYGLDDRINPQTLEQVGSKFGVTKERIRQIEARAINKLRKYATEAKLDLAFLN
ncbi:RNA polymerase principal sigma factor HrdA [Planctomycetes bacterium Pan216]|uniref:RNA polymerase principal sigma factor HrdA n=1 Tax=Kolteria novifilia TaxID=2527975 RepID=A0A518B9Z9_9BACT|nr:RNA polymerase principal sigma factor HrdA [Planctomycetes bacterium Pan216]